MLNNNPVLGARHFLGKCFFKEIILDGPLEKVKFYPICIEFRKRVAHLHSFIWIFNAPTISNEAAYNEFTEKTVNRQFPDHLNY